MGDRPPGPRVHLVARSAGNGSRAQPCGAGNAAGDGGRACRTAGCRPGGASACRCAKGQRPPAHPACSSSGRGSARHERTGGPTQRCCQARAVRRRRVSGQDRGHLVQHRVADATAGCVSGPDAGLAVPRQFPGLRREQHEPPEGRGRAGGAHRRRCQRRDTRRGAARNSRAERRLRRLPPAPGRHCTGCQDRNQFAPSQRQGQGLGR